MKVTKVQRNLLTRDPAARVVQNLGRQLRKGAPRAANRMMHLVDSEDDRVALAASTWVLERFISKAASKVEVSGEVSVTHQHLQAVRELSRLVRVDDVEDAVEVTPESKDASKERYAELARVEQMNAPTEVNPDIVLVSKDELKLAITKPHSKPAITKPHSKPAITKPHSEAGNNRTRVGARRARSGDAAPTGAPADRAAVGAPPKVARKGRRAE